MSLPKELKQTGDLSSLDGSTIAAIATAAGRGGVGIIRISGPNATSIGEQIARQSPPPRHALYTHFHSADDTVLDSGIYLFFPRPHSFTGEDVVELQAHGGPVILDLLLKECCLLGARPARPGEFSERAYLNDKMDLTQAEAIADLIASTTERAARNASQSLLGSFSREINQLVEAVTQLRIYVEAAIDFPEEEIDFIEEGQVAQTLEHITAQLKRVEHEAQQGCIAREGMKLVIAGKPNAGKSSLLNALSGQDTAIVTAIEGTTRDVLREDIQIDGMPLLIVDTAGLRESPDEIEQEGIRRAWKEMESADRILLVIDASTDQQELPQDELILSDHQRRLLDKTPITRVYNKCDLSKESPKVTQTDNGVRIHLSAKKHLGINLLTAHLKDCMGYSSDIEGRFSARRRHLQSLQDAAEYLQAGHLQIVEAGAGELLAEDLRQCQNSLGEITGAVSNDELLGKIFSSFCIGK
jgi:tRNA modification GTPase